MNTAPKPKIRRLVLVRPAQPGAAGVRRLLLAPHGDSLLPAPQTGAAAQGVRAP